jgi:hypothetical protein
VRASKQEWYHPGKKGDLREGLDSGIAGFGRRKCRQKQKCKELEDKV